MRALTLYVGPYHEPEFITITVTDPITAYDDNQKAYTTYELQTEARQISDAISRLLCQTTFPQYKKRINNVRRRYLFF